MSCLPREQGHPLAWRLTQYKYLSSWGKSSGIDYVSPELHPPPPPCPALPAPKFPSPEFPFDLHWEGNSSAQGWAPREHCHTNTQPFLLERCNSLESPYLAYRLAPYSGALPSEKQQAHITPLPLAGPAQMGSGTGQCHRKPSLSPEEVKEQSATCTLGLSWEVVSSMLSGVEEHLWKR